jgi:hypothetical protein
MTKEETVSTLRRKIKRLEDENKGLREMMRRAYEHNADVAISAAVRYVRIEQAIRILQGEDE